MTVCNFCLVGAYPGAVVSARALRVGLWTAFLEAVLCHALFATPL